MQEKVLINPDISPTFSVNNSQQVLYGENVAGTHLSTLLVSRVGMGQRTKKQEAWGMGINELFGGVARVVERFA